MTQEGWNEQVMDELRAAGFKPTLFSGFPHVSKPDSIEDIKRLLEVKLSVATSRRIYHEGMIFLPLGRSKETRS